MKITNDSGLFFLASCFISIKLQRRSLIYYMIKYDESLRSVG